MTSHKITTLLFDMGNVLIEFKPSTIVAHFCSDEATTTRLTQEIFLKEEWKALDMGLITEQEAEASICLRVPPKDHPLIHQIITSWPSTMTIKEEMIPLVKQLKAKGYRLFLASNASVRFYEYQDTIEALKSFEGILISAEIHQIKPKLAFYEALLLRFHLDSESCLLIDDLSDNILGAAQAGIEGIVFDGQLDHLVQSLREKGIL